MRRFVFQSRVTIDNNAVSHFHDSKPSLSLLQHRRGALLHCGRFCGQWKQRGAIADDPHVTANGGFLKRGMISFAGGGTDSRTTQLFVSLRDSKYLGKAHWETPIAQVVEGMDAVDAWYKGCAAVRHNHVAPVMVQLHI